MAYAHTAKRKTAPAKQMTWEWDREFRLEEEAREKEVVAAARRFRKTIVQ